jgi:hypothetical protein
MEKSREILKWVIIVFVLIFLFSISIAQYLPFEFANHKYSRFFYDFIFIGLPFSILLSLFWFIKKSRKKSHNIFLGFFIVLFSIAAFYARFFLIFMYGFGTWVNEAILYESKSNSQTTINQQLYDIGAFGYGGTRVIKTTPFLGVWNHVQEIDTASIDKNEWLFVNREGDLKFP